MDFLKFILSDIWIFLGFCIILSRIGAFIFRMYNRALRQRTLNKWGYPPPHCNVDGDFKEEDND